MKKILVSFLVISLVLVGLLLWFFFGSATSFSEGRRYLYVATGHASEKAVLDSIHSNGLLKYPALFGWAANRMNLWERIVPGRYVIQKGDNMMLILRRLRNRRQEPVKLVINKLRTNTDLAEALARNFEADSLEVHTFINSEDSLRKIGETPQTLMTIVIPNTYSITWNTPVKKILQRLKAEKGKFWQKNDRKQKAAKLDLTPAQVYTIASIVEEETNKNDEKGTVASVYINRYRAGMPLGADPTIKFALNDFSLKRIYNKHLQVESPYNTYRNKGLPPGPICTPSPVTIDAVLDAPSTEYLYFVARKDFSGYHTFSTNYAEHLKNAAGYQKALDELILRKQKASKSTF